MAMRVYMATPVNGRKEVTLTEKRKAAYQRVQEIKGALEKLMPNAEFHSSFDYWIAPLQGAAIWKEETVMGLCVQCVMTCDVIYMDDGWWESKGCCVERFTALTYGKKIIGYHDTRH